MPLAEIVTGAPRWLVIAIPAVVVATALVIWSYRTARSRGPVRVVAALFKWTGIAILAACLVEPLINTTRPRPGSNLFLVMADNSRSLQLADSGNRESRGKLMQAELADQSPWLARLGQDFDLRRYAFDTALHPVSSFAELTLDGEASALTESLSSLADRFRGQPVAGILLLTDGNATDLGETVRDWKGLPPVYAVPIGSEKGLVDLSVSHVAVTQTNFEAAPVTITASIEGRSVAGKEVGVRVVDENDKELERRDKLSIVEGEPLVERFLLRPEKPGVNFFTVQAFLKGEEQLPAKPGATLEATLANNRRIATVDRGGGPYRVLYVGGRPNWEFKFLRRAIDEDDEVHLVGLVRIAKREPTFKFLGRSGERTNPLFRGFTNQADEQAEQYDQPVLIRLHTEDKDELRGGFPKSPDDLFRYHALIIDDVESAFFSPDQLSLLQQFVSRRGGGLLMLGGKDSFFEGGYQRGAVGEMLPVYLDRAPEASSAAGYRLLLTREGWLQPWVRVRTNETDERQRLAGMPEFKTVNRIERIKPGAQVLAQVTSSDGAESPALVVQQFGRGRTAAMLVGDLWRWNLRRPDPAESDLDKSWRQTVRWLVSDVPGRVEVETRRVAGAAVPTMQISVRARDKQFELLDNATVTLRVETPDKRQIELVVEAGDSGPGRYEATFAARVPGVYRGQVSVTAPDGSEVGRRETGWSVEPQTEEFRTLSVNRSLLEKIAHDTEGEVISADGLDDFVAGLPNRKIPIVETKPFELWHRWQVLFAAMSCLVVEWGLRRWKGMP
ncbi:MAG TPA: glutamine amidotransferase [Planctomycetaceae bacterium]